MRADNHGEGGILALLALLRPADHAALARSSRSGLFGAALLYGDGVITPAISVLSAVEGLEVGAPHLEPFVRADHDRASSPGSSSCSGAARRGVGAVFGPATLVWFVSIAAARPPVGDPRAPGRHGVRPAPRGTLPARRTGTTDFSCSARSCSASPAARRSTPTWDTSAPARSGSRGTRSSSRRCS